MTSQARQGIGALSEREKQTLRLIVRGHDAKSIARALGLSVHTINERLREARRKVCVASSREAARLLFEAEGGVLAAPTPDSIGDAEIGEATTRRRVDHETAPMVGAERAQRRPWITIGAAVMTLAFAFVALAALPQLAAISAHAPTPPAAASAPAEAPDQAIVESARQWLGLLDQARWEESYRATGESFRALNTSEVWAAASERVRTPLGAMLSRTFISQENLPAPPSGYEVVKFRTRYANRAGAVETVTLNRENGGWHVVGVTIR